MKYNSLFLDVNILLEIVFKRDKYEFCIKKCLEYEILCISPTSIHVLYYFAEKAGFDTKVIEELLKSFVILSFGKDEYELAKSLYTGKDMEDCLQIAAALNHSISTVFSLDQDMIKKYSNKIQFIEI